MRSRAMALAALVAASGCTCGASHIIDDAGGGRDAGRVEDAGPPDGGRPDTSIGPIDAGARATQEECEAVYSGTRTIPCSPGTIGYCGEERCCFLVATCVDGMLSPTETSCDEDSVEASCAVGPANAMIGVVVDGTSFTLDHAYADHGVGFATYVDLTFTTDGRADVCTAQRLSISAVAPRFDLPPDAPAYDGVREVTFQWSDVTATPEFRFFRGQLTITMSLPFRGGGAVAGVIDVDVDGFRASGDFIAPECEPWRTSGS